MPGRDLLFAKHFGWYDAGGSKQVASERRIFVALRAFQKILHGHFKPYNYPQNQRYRMGVGAGFEKPKAIDVQFFCITSRFVDPTPDPSPTGRGAVERRTYLV
jgi:hypothetical protein